MKRLLDCFASEVKNMTRNDILDSIRASEGRVLLAEVSLVSDRPILENITDAELKSSMGAEMLLYNFMDVYHPAIPGIDCTDCEEHVHIVKDYTGRLVGANLEPVDPQAKTMGQIDEVCPGRLATVESALQAGKIGLDYILLTGNPGTGVTNEKIIDSLKAIRNVCGDNMVLMAGKMHAAGSVTDAGENIISKDLIHAFVEAGADIICLPAPGTVPGITLDYAKEMIMYAHSLGALTMTAIGTSQEGADRNTIQQIALMCKMAGTDIHHLGDACVGAIENIMYYGYVIRGNRHTFRSMAKSPMR